MKKVHSFSLAYSHHFQLSLNDQLRNVQSPRTYNFQLVETFSDFLALFPAITICNLNPYRDSTIRDVKTVEIIVSVFTNFWQHHAQALVHFFKAVKKQMFGSTVLSSVLPSKGFNLLAENVQ